MQCDNISSLYRTFSLTAAMRDLVQLVHGNWCSFRKLAKEFREYWYLKEKGVDIKAYKLSKVVQEGDENDGDSSTSPNNDNNTAEESRYNISKRQLFKTIKEIAVYEKRSAFKRACWYVNDNILEKYDLTQLVVPTNWVWVTKEPAAIVKVPTSESCTPVEGRPPTPLSQNAPKEGSIMKFTKPGVSPKPVKPIALSSKNSVTIEGKKTSCEKESTGNILKSSASPPQVSAGSKFTKLNSGVEVIKSESDFAESYDVLPLDTENSGKLEKMDIEKAEPKLDKNQPTLLSMFKKSKNSVENKNHASGNADLLKKPTENKENHNEISMGIASVTSLNDSEPNTKTDGLSILKTKVKNCELGSAENPMEID